MNKHDRNESLNSYSRFFFLVAKIVNNINLTLLCLRVYYPSTKLTIILLVGSAIKFTASTHSLNNCIIGFFFSSFKHRQESLWSNCGLERTGNVANGNSKTLILWLKQTKS